MRAMRDGRIKLVSFWWRKFKILDESISDRIVRVKFAVISSALNLFQAPKSVPGLVVSSTRLCVF